MSHNISRVAVSVLFLACAVLSYLNDRLDWQMPAVWAAIALLFFVSMPRPERSRSQPDPETTFIKP
jgi:uncharacterized membrane protein